MRGLPVTNEVDFDKIHQEALSRSKSVLSSFLVGATEVQSAAISQLEVIIG